jgi:hypothetical protein
MSPEFWSAFFSGATFIVIAASAIAALIQLRHLRSSNQLAGMIEINRMWHDPQIQSWFNYVRDDLPDKLKDPLFRDGLLSARIDRRIHVELYAADYWEQIGAYVKYGLIDENSLLDLASDAAVGFWEMLWPVTQLRRQTSGPALYENFEYLAVRARQWVAQRPGGAYPKGMPRYAQLEPYYGRLTARPDAGPPPQEVTRP